MCAHYDRTHHRSNAEASPVDPVGSDIEYRTTVCMFKTNAIARCSYKSAVGSPKGHHSSAVRSPTTQYEHPRCAQRSLCKRRGRPHHLQDVTAPSTLLQRSINAVKAQYMHCGCLEAQSKRYDTSENRQQELGRNTTKRHLSSVVTTF